MQVVLTEEDLKFIDGFIRKGQFEVVFPLYQFFTKKIADTQAAQTPSETTLVNE